MLVPMYQEKRGVRMRGAHSIGNGGRGKEGGGGVETHVSFAWVRVGAPARLKGRSRAAPP